MSNENLLMFTTWFAPATRRLYILVDTRELEFSSELTHYIFVRTGGNRNTNMTLSIQQFSTLREKGAMVQVFAETMDELILKYSQTN